MKYKCRVNFLLMGNKLRKLFVIRQSEECKFMRKMNQNTFGEEHRPAGGAYAPPPRDPLSAIGVYL